jgi:hypothetical protein
VVLVAVATGDVGPRKLRRNAAARQHVVRLDRGRLGLADFLIGKAYQLAVFHIHRGDHEGGFVGVEAVEIDVIRQRLQQLMRLVEVRPCRRSQQVGAIGVKMWNIVERKIAIGRGR